MSMSFFQSVGNNISEILLEQDKSQQYLANKLDISKQVMSKIVSGSKAINVSEISQIADALAVPVGRLLKVKGETINHSFAFMGKVENAETKGKIELLRKVIDELLMLEEYAND